MKNKRRNGFFVFNSEHLIYINREFKTIINIFYPNINSRDFFNNTAKMVKLSGLREMEILYKKEYRKLFNPNYIPMFDIREIINEKTKYKYLKLYEKRDETGRL